MCLRLYLNGDGTGRGTHLSLFFVVMKGPNDALLRWPFNQKVHNPSGGGGCVLGRLSGLVLWFWPWGVHWALPLSALGSWASWPLEPLVRSATLESLCQRQEHSSGLGWGCGLPLETQSPQWVEELGVRDEVRAEPGKLLKGGWRGWRCVGITKETPPPDAGGSTGLGLRASTLDRTVRTGPVTQGG